MPADGMGATGSPERRFGTPVSVAPSQSLTETFDNGKTVVSIGSKPTRTGDDWPQPSLSCRRLSPQQAKMLIGRIERGFDFLGYHFGQAGGADNRNFIEKASRLYEQERSAFFGRDCCEFMSMLQTVLKIHGKGRFCSHVATRCAVFIWIAAIQCRVMSRGSV